MKEYKKIIIVVVMLLLSLIIPVSKVEARARSRGAKYSARQRQPRQREYRQRQPRQRQPRQRQPRRRRGGLWHCVECLRTGVYNHPNHYRRR